MKGEALHTHSSLLFRKKLSYCIAHGIAHMGPHTAYEAVPMYSEVLIAMVAPKNSFLSIRTLCTAHALLLVYELKSTTQVLLLGARTLNPLEKCWK